MSKDYWLYDVSKKYFDNFFIPYVKKHKRPGDVIFHLGDFFDNRSSLDVNVLHYGISLMKELAEILPVHVLIGNHDLYTEKSLDIHSVSWMNLINNVTLYEKPTVLTFDSASALMMPWVTTQAEEIKILSSHKANYVFCHSDLKGAKNNQTIEMKHGIDIQHFQRYQKVYSGHIHLRQVIKNFQFIGCPYHLDRNDKSDHKGISILDFETGNLEFVANTYSPEYKTLTIANELDLLKIEKFDFQKDHVDLKISNKLLIENKNVRSRIEKMVQSHSFSAIEWKDDIKLENLINENDLKFDQSTNEFNFNIKNLTYEYVGRQKFENDEVRDKIVSILDMMFEIWENKPLE